MMKLYMAVCASLLFYSLAIAIDESWWLTETYEASELQIQGIPIANIDSAWVAAGVLRRDSLSSGAQHYLDSHEWTQGWSFSLEDDFNRDGFKDRTVVGIYRDKTGAAGTFVLILTHKKNGWSKAFLATEKNHPGFSMIKNGGQGLILWTHCFECDTVAEIYWDGKSYKLEYPSNGD
ncbi:MAG: hypothetical protein HY266_08645 [Deltaproteobacteria bacterium]|nr:hypothetical protein [Deltaproteobacteria bacterium]